MQKQDDARPDYEVDIEAPLENADVDNSEIPERTDEPIDTSEVEQALRATDTAVSDSEEALYFDAAFAKEKVSFDDEKSIYGEPELISRDETTAESSDTALPIHEIKPSIFDDIPHNEHNYIRVAYRMWRHDPEVRRMLQKSFAQEYPPGSLTTRAEAFTAVKKHTRLTWLGLQESARARWVGQARAELANSPPPMTMSIEVVRSPGEKWGLRLEHTAEDGLILQGKAEGSPAARAQFLEAGMIIDKINGIDISECSMDHIGPLITKCDQLLLDVRWTSEKSLAADRQDAPKKWAMPTAISETVAQREERLAAEARAEAEAQAEEEQRTAKFSRRQNRSSRRQASIIRRRKRREVDPNLGSSEDSTDVEADTDEETETPKFTYKDINQDIDEEERNFKALVAANPSDVVNERELVTLTRQSVQERWGVRIQPISDGLAVLDISPDTIAAATSRLQPGLVIDEINGISWTNIRTFEAIAELISTPLKIVLSVHDRVDDITFGDDDAEGFGSDEDLADDE